MENETEKQKLFRVVTGISLVGFSIYLLLIAIKTYKTNE
jgi:hypothetical protein